MEGGHSDARRAALDPSTGQPRADSTVTAAGVSVAAASPAPNARAYAANQPLVSPGCRRNSELDVAVGAATYELFPRSRSGRLISYCFTLATNVRRGIPIIAATRD